MAAASQPAPAPLKPAERARILAEQLMLLNLGKACYKRADALLDLLVAQPDRYRPAKITKRSLGRKKLAAQLREAQKQIAATLEGRNFGVIDKFASRNAINVGQNARRFEIDEITAA